jgi:maleylacetate reductase
VSAGAVPFRYPATGAIWTGAGSLERLGEALDTVGATSCLAVVTPSLACDEVFMHDLRAAAGGRIAALFGDVRPHAPYTTVLAAAGAGTAAGVDVVVSVGGGSAIDTARLAAVSIERGLGPGDEHAFHELRVQTGADGPIFPLAAAAPLPHVAVPTTLSAAEFSDGGAATCPWTGRKEVFAGRGLACAAVIADPELAMRTPARTWVMTGVRALDHAVETLLSPRSSPPVDELAARAIALLRECLPAALAEPDNTAARERGQLASWLSYFGVPAGTLGLSHAIGHQLGGSLGIAHGLASCITLPDVLALVLPRAGDKADVLARAFGGAQPIATVDELVRGLGFPRRLRELGIDDLDTSALADAILEDVLVLGTPGGPPDRGELVVLLETLAR